jgi:hypothetical protein
MGANGMAINWSIEPGIYYIKVDEQHFIKDVIQYDPHIEVYKKYKLEDGIPHDILWGYYQLLDGKLVINAEQKEIFDEANKIIEPEIVEEELKTEE